jgi:hypothetical protein
MNIVKQPYLLLCLASVFLLFDADGLEAQLGKSFDAVRHPERLLKKSEDELANARKVRSKAKQKADALAVEKNKLKRKAKDAKVAADNALKLQEKLNLEAAAAKLKNEADEAAKDAEKRAKEAAEAAERKASEAAKIAEKNSVDASKVELEFEKAVKDLQAATSEALDAQGRHTEALRKQIESETQEIVKAWKENGENASKDWKEFVEYWDGIDKTIYEEEIELSDDGKSSLIIIDYAINRLNVTITVEHIDGGPAAFSLYSQRKTAWVKRLVPVSASQSAYTTQLSHPVIQLSLSGAGRNRTSKIRVRMTQRKGTFEDLWDSLKDQEFADPNPPSGPDEDGTSGENSDVSASELKKITEDAYRLNSNGFYFSIKVTMQWDGTQLIEAEEPLAWYGPYAKKEDAVQDITNFSSVLNDGNFLAEYSEVVYLAQHPSPNLP